jgi:pimeloyl-ACP methyl ester carboxylesterase
MMVEKTGKKIYLISGLGVDERIFQHLDFGELTPHFIQWITPKNDESMGEYAQRLSEQIEEEKPIVLGVSFGGMLAVEMANLIDCQQVIIVSSAKNRDDIPFYFRILGRLRLHKLVPIALIKHVNFWTYWLFSMTKKHEKRLLKNIIHDTDDAFIKWAINAILTWKTDKILPNVVHIHGDADRLLPINNRDKMDVIVPKGGHLMVYNRAHDISKIVADILKPENLGPLSITP